MPEDPGERTMLDLPDHLAADLRHRSEQAAVEIEAHLSGLVATAYRTGWADGYLARHHETQETRHDH